MSRTRTSSSASTHRPAASRPRQSSWSLNLGANLVSGGGRFRVWAPRRKRVDVVVEGRQPIALSEEDEGYFSGTIPGLGAGALYRYRLDGGDSFPDPVSRFQPQGPHGPSEVIDPEAYRWRNRSPADLRLKGQVVYELHIGAFTQAGTFQATIPRLSDIRNLGATLVEIMPVAEFSGRWGWGYDGVDLFAPFHHYGRPEDLKALIDAAHGLGLGVILDVVYNHFGPDGNYLREFGDTYFSPKHKTDWGDGINYDAEGSAGVRHLVTQNACFWVAEYRFDGLRLDATMDIKDESPVHILADLSRASRKAAGRPILLIGESEPQDVRLVTAVEDGGYGLDAIWCDDFHHTARVALTGQRTAYYFDYTGTPQELLSCIKRGPLYQGQRYQWQDQPRGWSVRNEPAAAFVYFLQNHDQVANLLDGERLHRLCHPGNLRALTALLLLAPETPLLFMGQEFAASAPFMYFSDHNPELQKKIDQGRVEFLDQFINTGTREARAAIPKPGAEQTFLRSKLDFAERATNSHILRLHRDLLRLRRDDRIISRQERFSLDGAVLSPTCFVLRFFGPNDDDRLLVVNLGRDWDLIPAPEPLLAPVDRGGWRVLWSSEAVRYGGLGIVPPYFPETGWRLSATSTVLLRARPGRRP